MNLVLGTLEELKAHLLNEGLRSATDFDGTLTGLGLGIAARFEKTCGRKFARVEDDTFEFSGDRDHIGLPRYPVESIASVELRETLTTGWVDQGTVNELVAQLMAESGVVLLHGALGGWADRVRLTYTGGYWIDESADGSIDNRTSVQQGRVDLTEGDESKVITFGVEFVTAPKVMITLVPPEGGVIISVVPQAPITVTGCTALLAAPVPGAGYALHWIAVSSNSAGSGGALPTGATELPADLKLAWLLQCEHVWRLRDKLGTSVAETAKTAADMAGLASMQLLPEVEAILRHYRRYALT